MKSRLLLFLSLYLAPLSGVGTDLYSPSLPAIVKDLAVPSLLVKLTLSAYLLGFSLGQLCFGTLSDIYGRKPTLLVSLVAFCVTSYLATLTHSIYLLLLIRIIQGFSGAGASVISKALLSDTLTGAELKKASIYLIAVWGLGPIIAPVIGGYLQHYYGWHANFYFFTAYSFSMIVLVALLLKETNISPSHPSWASIFKNYRKILSNPAFIANAVCMGLGYSVIMVFNLFTPFLVQSVLDYSAITYGRMALFIGVAFLLGCLINRWLIHFNIQKVNRIAMSMTMLVAAITLVSIYFMNMTLWTITIPIVFIVFFTAILHTNFIAHCLSLFPHIGGTAAASIGSIICLVAGSITVIASFIHHAGNQIPVSWLYGSIVLLYFGVYWLVVDKSCRQKEAAS